MAADRKLEAHPPLYLSIPLVFFIFIEYIYIYIYSFRREGGLVLQVKEPPHSSGAAA
jgi:hypothetical protein